MMGKETVMTATCEDDQFRRRGAWQWQWQEDERLCLHHWRGMTTMLWKQAARIWCRHRRRRPSNKIRHVKWRLCAKSLTCKTWMPSKASLPQTSSELTNGQSSSPAAVWLKCFYNGKSWPIILTGAHVELICKNSTPIQPDSIKFF